MAVHAGLQRTRVHFGDVSRVNIVAGGTVDNTHFGFTERVPANFHCFHRMGMAIGTKLIDCPCCGWQFRTMCRVAGSTTRAWFTGIMSYLVNTTAICLSFRPVTDTAGAFRDTRPNRFDTVSILICTMATCTFRRLHFTRSKSLTMKTDLIALLSFSMAHPAIHGMIHIEVRHIFPVSTGLIMAVDTGKAHLAMNTLEEIRR